MEETAKELERVRNECYRDILQQLFPRTQDMFQLRIYETYQLKNYVFLEIKRLQDRLEKAKKVFKVQEKILDQYRQMDMFSCND